jgi:5-(carboxyamino)imidazole ribonucleotide synthase
MTTIGVLGGGQLGWMLALAGYPLDLRFRFWEPAPGSPAGRIAEQVTAPYDDPVALADFSEGIELATYEFENVPVEIARTLAQRIPVYPPPTALETAQDRLNEKRLFQHLGIPAPRFALADTWEQLLEAVEEIGLPAVLKTRRGGYDGKGQAVLRERSDVERAWSLLQGANRILESFVPFDREVSLVAARSVRGETVFYPLAENYHREGILRLTLAPAPVLSPAMQARAQEYMERLLQALDYAGVLAVEFFACGEELFANEIAPRVHNSGHWTIEGAETSQFANHLRAILGLPLGSAKPLGRAAMVNLIGAVPDTATLLAVPHASLHLYGKAPRPGRKLGHITLRAESREALDASLTQILSLADCAPGGEGVNGPSH